MMMREREIFQVTKRLFSFFPGFFGVKDAPKIPHSTLISQNTHSSSPLCFIPTFPLFPISQTSLFRLLSLLNFSSFSIPPSPLFQLLKLLYSAFSRPGRSGLLTIALTGLAGFTICTLRPRSVRRPWTWLECCVSISWSAGSSAWVR